MVPSLSTTDPRFLKWSTFFSSSPFTFIGNGVSLVDRCSVFATLILRPLSVNTFCHDSDSSLFWVSVLVMSYRSTTPWYYFYIDLHVSKMATMQGKENCIALAMLANEMRRNLLHENPHLTSMDDLLNCLNEWSELSNAPMQWRALWLMDCSSWLPLFDEPMSKTSCCGWQRKKRCYPILQRLAVTTT